SASRDSAGGDRGLRRSYSGPLPHRNAPHPAASTSAAWTGVCSGGRVMHIASRSSWSWAAALLVALAPPAATSQEAAGFSGLDEIIVTAQRREERLQSVPVAVTAMDSEALERFQVTALSEISTVVPNLWME